MNQCVDETIRPSLANDADFMKHPGVNVYKQYGKWVAKIRHPIKKVWVCVGIYNTLAEAANAYTKKKLEYESCSLQEKSPCFDTNVADFDKQPGVKYTTSGKWMAVIKHKKVQVSLGTYNTPNEAADARNLSILELQQVKRSRICRGGKTVEALNGEKCEKKGRPHAYRSRYGRWRTEIKHPITKGKKIYLGTFDTAEEAEEAYNSMRQEFDLVFPGGVHLGSFTDEAYNNMMHDVDLMVLAHKKRNLSVSTNGSSEMEASREGERGVFDHLGVIDSYGRFVGEYSRIDDELWICDDGHKC